MARVKMYSSRANPAPVDADAIREIRERSVITIDEARMALAHTTSLWVVNTSDKQDNKLLHSVFVAINNPETGTVEHLEIPATFAPFELTSAIGVNVGPEVILRSSHFRAALRKYIRLVGDLWAEEAIRNDPMLYDEHNRVLAGQTGTDANFDENRMQQLIDGHGDNVKELQEAIVAAAESFNLTEWKTLLEYTRNAVTRSGKALNRLALARTHRG